MSRATKVALGTSAAAGVGLGIFLLTRKARAAESDAAAARGEAARARGEAASAAARAASATQAAYDAERRLQDMQARLYAAQAQTQLANQAAAAAVAQANAQARAAADAANAARQALQAAQAERQVDRRVALEREAALKAQHAQEVARLAREAADAAARAEAAARARADAERKLAAEAATVEKQRQQAVVVAQEQRQIAAKQTDAATLNLECARQAVASAFASLRDEVARRNPKYTPQQAVNAAAKMMRDAGIILDAPNPALPFWQQPCTTVRVAAEQVVSAYRNRAQPQATVTPATVTQTPPGPVVATTPEAQKREWVKDAWSQALQYAMDVHHVIGKPVSAREAETLYGTAFREGSQLGPGFPVVPYLRDLSTPDPFWALSVTQVRDALARAIEAAVRKVNLDSELIVLAFPASSRDGSAGSLIYVAANKVQKDPAGKVIMREGPAIAGRRVYYPVATADAQPVNPAQMLNRQASAFAGAAPAPSIVPFCTVV